jgi:gentisate 1,2-dioxygenase
VNCGSNPYHLFGINVVTYVPSTLGAKTSSRRFSFAATVALIAPPICVASVWACTTGISDRLLRAKSGHYFPQEHFLQGVRCETRFGDSTVRWSARDIFTLPKKNPIQHRASGKPAKLFITSDREILQRLGVLKEHIG